MHDISSFNPVSIKSERLVESEFCKQIDASKEILKEWIVPQFNNWKLLKYIPAASQVRLKRMYAESSENCLIIAESPLFKSGNNGGIFINLFSVKDDIMYLIQSVHNGDKRSRKEYQTENVYLKMPGNGNVARWFCRDLNNNTYHNCKSYWLEYRSENSLIVEREIFDIKSNALIRSITEYYSKWGGLYKLKMNDTITGRILNKAVLLEGGFDETINDMLSALLDTSK